MTQNAVTVCGNLTRDPELKFVGAKQIPLCRLSLAVNEKFGETEKVHFIDVNVWHGAAEECAVRLTKGAAVMVLGRLNFEQWEDKASGAKRSKLSVTAELIGQPFFKAKGAAPAQPENKPAPAAPAAEPGDEKDDVPF